VSKERCDGLIHLNKTIRDGFAKELKKAQAEKEVKMVENGPLTWAGAKTCGGVFVGF